MRALFIFFSLSHSRAIWLLVCWLFVHAARLCCFAAKVRAREKERERKSAKESKTKKSRKPRCGKSYLKLFKCPLSDVTRQLFAFPLCRFPLERPGFPAPILLRLIPHGPSFHPPPPILLHFFFSFSSLIAGH